MEKINCEDDLISIIIPVYNGSTHLSQAIESCLKQTYKNIEVIIIDDGSVDNSLEIAEVFAQKDDRIKIFRNYQNRGLPYSLNRGHIVSTSKYQTWISDDNYFFENALQELIITLKEKSSDIVYSNYIKINEDDDYLSEVICKSVENILFGNCIGACFLYTKEIFFKVGGYNENYFLVEDYDFWLKASLVGSFYHLNMVLMAYRKHEYSLTSQIFKDINKYNKWLNVSRLVYSDFIAKMTQQNYSTIASIFAANLTANQVNFSTLKACQSELNVLRLKMSHFPNFSNQKKMNKVWYNFYVNSLVADTIKFGYNFRNWFFLYSQHSAEFRNIFKRAISVFVKYSFKIMP